MYVCNSDFLKIYLLSNAESIAGYYWPVFWNKRKNPQLVAACKFLKNPYFYVEKLLFFQRKCQRQ